MDIFCARQIVYCVVYKLGELISKMYTLQTEKHRTYVYFLKKTTPICPVCIIYCVVCFDACVVLIFTACVCLRGFPACIWYSQLVLICVGVVLAGGGAIGSPLASNDDHGGRGGSSCANTRAVLDVGPLATGTYYVSWHCTLSDPTSLSFLVLHNGVKEHVGVPVRRLFMWC